MEENQENICSGEQLPLVLTADEVAALLRCDRKLVYALFNEGKLPGGHRIGRIIRFSRNVLLEWLNKQEKE